MVIESDNSNMNVEVLYIITSVADVQSILDTEKQNNFYSNEF